ncbi:biotin--[acetyl-CoA-carboxylase] ligase [Wenyingzhuangia sp. 2_MG-2023]|uniref:biotin--[acetyl-CoA-carboxylase] ligase n=1 Tax=Wenyingzhuangia sp. 2_MG-2023 TaxID=3062639 RepID=UPI0026E24E54|nr:biotin--[acetyl-CoA-carboxylase] ligase [Wenyingzhuangia sp. 2_MG-2023]MDO6737820.1 biotin--[acetyl-CoA-carboxylase] ligase [Wenyingzhuangia sp. 2_MG-2023]
MNIIKLSAIDSTSRFLKDLSKKDTLKNFTIAVANVQSQGKGQRNTQWHSEDGKNLLFTLYVEFQSLPVCLAPVLSFLSALKIREVLDRYLGSKAKIQIKWPNDIMSYNSKMAGILVENTLNNNGITSSLIGVGLNVNQIIFPDFLPNATSMALVTGMDFDRELLLKEILTELKLVLTTRYILENQLEIKQTYLSYLYKLKIPTMFKDATGGVFMGKITGVSDVGKLVVEKQDELEYEYEVKEVSFLL